MLGYIDSAAVTRNASEKKLNSLLDFVGASTDAELLQRFYETTLRALETAKNDRLWFKTSLKLCGLWFRLREYGRMARVLKELHR
jgi:COP9 signalosome complex subunit 2